MNEFDRFIGIDFSGAKGPGLKGLRVADALRNKRAVNLVQNPYRDSGIWRRSDLGAWLVEQARRSQERIFVGMDLAFGFPYIDRGAYFPGLKNGPKSVRALWKLVEAESGGDEVRQFYAGRVYLDDRSRLREYFMIGSFRGSHYEGRTRVMESGSRVVPGANPTTVFNLVGPATVGVSSLSGMRLALWLDGELGNDLAFWPFDQERCRDASMVVTEIFPRLYYLRAGEQAGAWRIPSDFARVLRAYDATCEDAVITEDEGDSIVCAAALRALSKETWTWEAPLRERIAATREGWIYGAE